jgi:hypothetical protein
MIKGVDLMRGQNFARMLKIVEERLGILACSCLQINACFTHA